MLALCLLYQSAVLSATKSANITYRLYRKEKGELVNDSPPSIDPTISRYRLQCSFFNHDAMRHLAPLIPLYELVHRSQILQSL